MATERPHFVERIMKELTERHGALTAGEAARLADRSKSRVRHAFREAQGISFRTARVIARLERGRFLLDRSSKSVYEISAILLYSERSKFEKSFKRRYGVTPSQYRKLADYLDRGGKPVKKSDSQEMSTSGRR